MTKQCGNCKWWDYDNASYGFSDCLAHLPSCLPVDIERYSMDMYEGQDCPVFKERKE